MWILEGFTWGMTSWYDECYTFEEAKIGLREHLKEQLGNGRVSVFTDPIDAYCRKYYPEGAPEELAAYKQFLISLCEDTVFPEDPDKQMEEAGDFEDERVEVYWGWMPDDGLFLRAYANDEEGLETDEVFTQAEINLIKMDDPDREYYFFVSTKKRERELHLTLRNGEIQKEIKWNDDSDGEENESNGEELHI